MRYWPMVSEFFIWPWRKLSPQARPVKMCRANAAELLASTECVCTETRQEQCGAVESFSLWRLPPNGVHARVRRFPGERALPHFRLPARTAWVCDAYTGEELEAFHMFFTPLATVFEHQPAVEVAAGFEIAHLAQRVVGEALAAVFAH